MTGKVVIDTNNYYFERDGHYPEIDEGRTTPASCSRSTCGSARVVKAFNAIQAAQIGSAATPAGSAEPPSAPDRRRRREAKQIVSDLIDEFGFDVVDAGPLAEGKRSTATSRRTAPSFRRRVAGGVGPGELSR